MTKAAFVDSVTELNKSLGSARDWTVNATWSDFMPLDAAALSNAYGGSWLARKVIDIPAFDMVRAWRDWQAEDGEIEAIEAEEARIQLRPRLTKGLKLARLFGGACLVMGVDQGQSSEELRPDTVRKGGLKFIHVLSRDQISAGEIEQDITSPYFGEPKVYTLSGATGTSAQIHPSRVVRLIGAERLGATRLVDGWGDSILDAVSSALIQAQGSSQGIAGLVLEAKIDVWRIPNFMANVGSPAYRDKVVQRVRLAQTSKSTVNGLLMDKEEEYDQKQVSFAQLPETLQLFLTIASGAADIPATRLLGQSPGGMNATGESDLRNYYDRISAEQELSLRPALERLDEVLIRSALGARPPEVHYTFAPLWQLSETDRATIRKQDAETARTYAIAGLLPLSALAKGVQNALVEQSAYPGLEAALADAEKVGEKAEGPVKSQPDPAADDEEKATKKGQQAKDAAPRPLYVSRKLINAAEFLAWAKAQGFDTTLAADDLHVTVTYSRTPVDWMKMGQDWVGGDGKGGVTVPAGGPRLVEPLGDKGAVVLLFSSTDLQWRHADMERNGASWDHDEYQPHVTITYQGEGVDLTKVEPYRGPLAFGPEIFEEIIENWEAGREGSGPF